MQVLKSAVLGLGLLAAPLAAQAVPLSGSIDFTGLFRGEDASGTNVRLAEATAIDFCAATTGFCTTDPGAGTGSGAFAINRVSQGANLPVSVGDTGTIQDPDFTNFSGTITNFFTVGGLTFDLESITVDQFTSPPVGTNPEPIDFLLIGGSGTLCAAGFDCTEGSFTFSGQSDGRNLEGTFTFSGGAATVAPVPAPAGLALLGAGLLGLALVRRKAA